MQFAHIKNIEKFHPGYKDRTLQWAKIYIKMVQGDPDCEMIVNEIDWARLIKFILLELQAQKPIPLDPFYLQKKGFDLKKRPISATLKELHAFVEVRNETVTEPLRFLHVDKEKDKEEYREEKEKDKEVPYQHFSNDSFKKAFKDFSDSRISLKSKMTPRAEELILKKLQKETVTTAIKMLEQSIECGYKGVFPLKKSKGAYNGQASNRLGNEEHGKYDAITTVIE